MNLKVSSPLSLLFVFIAHMSLVRLSSSTLSQAKQPDLRHSSVLNNIAKLDPKDDPLEQQQHIGTSTMTTVTSSANNSSVSTHAPTLHKGEDSSSSSSSTWVEMTMEEKNHRAVWVTLIVCLNVVLFTVIALCVRTSYACYQKLKKAQALAEANRLSSLNAAPSVRYASGDEPRIYTVMPGHYVIQPCFTPPMPPQFQEAEMREARCIAAAYTNTIARAETPPPPYPGFLPPSPTTSSSKVQES